MSNIFTLFSCLLMLGAVERAQSSPVSSCQNIPCPSDCEYGTSIFIVDTCSQCSCSVFSCDEITCAPGQSCQLLPHSTCLETACEIQNQAFCVGICPDFLCDLVCPYGAAPSLDGCVDNCNCLSPCPICDQPDEACFVKPMLCASGAATGCYLGVCLPQEDGIFFGTPVLPIPSNPFVVPGVNPPAPAPTVPGVNPPVTVPTVPGVNPPVTVPTVPGVNPPVTGPSVPAANPPVTVSTVPGVNPPVTGPSVPAVNPPVTGPSVPAVNPPVTGPSVPAVNPPVTGPSVPAVNPPVTGPSVPAVNPTIPSGGGPTTVEVPALTGGL